MNINEARLVSFVTFLTNEELNNYNIDKLINLVKACYPIPEHSQLQLEAESVRVDLKHLFDAMLSNRKIDAVKEYRQLTGAVLKEAKEEVERIMYRIKGE